MEALYVHIANKLEGIRFGPQPSGNKIFSVDELKSVSLWRAVFAETLAQFLFVILGVCSAMAMDKTSDAWLIKISLAFGLAIMALIQMIGHVSGGHINPAVSIAMAVSMNISVLRCLLYVVAQVVGATLGGFVAKGLTPSVVNTSDGIMLNHHDNLACTAVSADVTVAQAFGMELILTFCLVTVIYGTTDPNRASFGSPAVLIGLTVALGHLVGIQYTGASMNPSRTFGSAIASSCWENHWVYWVAPIAGGVLSSLIYKFILCPYKGVTSIDEAIERMNGDSGLRSPRYTQRSDLTNEGFTNGGLTNDSGEHFRGVVKLTNENGVNGHGVYKREGVISTHM